MAFSKMRLSLTALLLFGMFAGCTYGKSYFRIGPDGKMIKADGPIVPGEDTSGIATGGDGTGTAGTGTGTGGDGTITPTAGTGGGTATAGTTGGIPGIPIYPMAIHAEDKTSSAHNLYLARFSEGVFMETPKKLTANTDSKNAIMFPSISPDASKILYFSLAGTGSIFDGTFNTDGGLHLLTNLQATPSDAAWNATDPGVSASWTANGEEVVYIAGGCGLLRKAKSSGADAVNEGTQPTGDYDKWVYFQSSASPVTDASHPAHDTILFGMFSADGAANEGAELFLKKAGDTDQSHYMRLTNTLMTIEMYPSISPDGKYVLFGALDASAPGTSADSAQKITVCDLVFTTGVAACQNARTLDTMPAGSVNSSPCWSWDSSKIFFTSKDATTKKYDIFMIDFTGGAFGAAAVNISNTTDLDEMEVSCASAPVVK